MDCDFMNLVFLVKILTILSDIRSAHKRQRGTKK